MSKPASNDPLILVAQIGPPHGVSGAFKLLTFTQEPKSVLEYAPLLDQHGNIALKSLKPLSHKGAFVVTADEISTREAALAQKGFKLYVPRTRFETLEDEDDFYIIDLIGLKTKDVSENFTGVIIGVENFGAGDLLHVRNALGKSVFISFTRENVPHVHLKDGYVVISSSLDE
jgi:16S rRNA processing protein RimM